MYTIVPKAKAHYTECTICTKFTFYIYNNLIIICSESGAIGKGPRTPQTLYNGFDRFIKIYYLHSLNCTVKNLKVQPFQKESSNINTKNGLSVVKEICLKTVWKYSKKYPLTNLKQVKCLKNRC